MKALLRGTVLIAAALALPVAGVVRAHAEDSAPTAAVVEAPAPGTAAPDAPAGALTLQDCYREALLNDPAIRSARAGFEEATGQKIVLQARALPRIGAGIVAGEQGPRYNTTNPHKRLFILVSGSFQQALFDAAIPASFRLGKINLAIAEQKFNRTAMNELYALRIAFDEALAARENVAVQKSIQGRLQANVDAQENQQKVGKVSQRVVGQARVQLNALAPGLAAAQNAYEAARIELARRLGRDLGAGAVELPVPQGSLEAEPLDVDVAAETAYALAHRPDLLALRSAVAAAQEQKNIVEAGYLPTIDLVANFQYIPQASVHKSGTVVQAGNTVETTELLYGVAGTWNVIDVGTVRGGAQTAQANKEAYALALKQLQDNLPGQIRQAQAALQQAATLLEGSEQTIALADENLRTIEGQVANGDLPQLDFINAQSNLLQARFNRINALLINNTAIAQLDILTGRTLEFVDTDAAGRPR